MAQERGERQHDGLLIRGADGSLWFMRDDAVAPVRVREELAESMNELLEREPHREFGGLSPSVVKLLMDQFDDLVPWGAIHWRTTRLPR